MNLYTLTLIANVPCKLLSVSSMAIIQLISMFHNVYNFTFSIYPTIMSNSKWGVGNVFECVYSFI